MNSLPEIFKDDSLTNIPLVYSAQPYTLTPKLHLWISIIGPSGAGKDAIKSKLLHTNKFFNIKTCTNRKKRKDESEDSYIWMREQRSNEPKNAYLRHLINEYKLFEYNFHYGNMYGTPIESIKAALLSKKIALYCSEEQGANFISKTLNELFNIITISIIPDSLEDMENRILMGARDNQTLRLKESLDKVNNADKFSNFILKNPSKPVEKGKSGLESAVNSIKRLIFEKLAIVR